MPSIYWAEAPTSGLLRAHLALQSPRACWESSYRTVRACCRSILFFIDLPCKQKIGAKGY